MSRPCVHPPSRQIRMRREPHPVMGSVLVYRCMDCGREQRRLRIFEHTVAEIDLERFRNHARLMCREAVLAGLLERPDRCERCGMVGSVEAHHYDYGRPLEVEWLCPKCHRAADEARRQAEQAA